MPPQSETIQEQQASSSVVPAQPVPVPRRRTVWGGRTFRFNLHNFRLTNGVSVRRFSIVEAAVLLMAAMLASRVLGVVRQVTFNAMFDPGSSQVQAYIAATRLPDTLYNLIAGGALIHAFVPVFLSFEKEKGEYEAWRLSSLVFNALFVLLTLILLISELLAPDLVTAWLVPGFSPATKELTVTLTRIMLLQPLILGVGTVAAAILNSKRQFLLPALSLAVYNIGLLAGLLVARLVPGVGIYGITYGTVVAAILQAGVMVPGLVKQHMRYFFTWNLNHPGLRQVGWLLLPNALAIGIFSVGNLVETNFSSYLPDFASLAALQNAEMLQALPIALVAQAVGQSLLPHLTVHAASHRYQRMWQTVLQVMGVSIALTIPAALLLIGLGKPLIYLLFRHGAFTPHAADLTYVALTGYALALPGMAAANLISAGFFAFKDAFTPFLCNTFALITRWLLLIFLFKTLDGSSLILAIPLALVGSATAEAIVQGALLLFRLRKRIPQDRGMQRLQRRRLYREEVQQAGRFRTF